MMEDNLEENMSLLERLAELEHQQWAHWTRYLMNNFDNDHIELWDRLCDTPYINLTEQEKNSDREWARKVIGLMESHIIQPSKLEEINAVLNEIKDLANHILTNRDAAPDIAIIIEVAKIEEMLGLK